MSEWTHTFLECRNCGEVTYMQLPHSDGTRNLKCLRCGYNEHVGDEFKRISDNSEEIIAKGDRGRIWQFNQRMMNEDE